MRAQRSPQAGFTYLGILAAIVVMGVVLAAAARVWTLTEQRERETQLLFVGDAIRMAIGAYYSHGGRYPMRLEDLVLDDRSPTPVRYLRRIYLDPMTNSTDWKLVPAPEGGIKGVYSASTLTPIKLMNFPSADASFDHSDCYCTWQFVYEPRYRPRVAPITVPAPAPGVPLPPAPGTI
jgi:type II secretory pathway pseudopilin PulG